MSKILPAKRSLRLVAFLIEFFCTIGLCFADCPDSLEIVAERVVGQGVSIRWTDGGLFEDTVFGSSGIFQSGYFIGSDYSDQRIAFRLPGGLSGRILTQINCYFLAAQFVSESEWEDSADYRWSLCQDDQGQPGSPASPELAVDLASDPNIRVGRWVSTDADWLIPDSVPDDFWLVGRWPSSAVSCVRVGAAWTSEYLETLVGIGDGSGGIQWIDTSTPQFLLELIFRDPDQACDAVTELSSENLQIKSSAGTYFVVERQAIRPVEGISGSDEMLPVSSSCLLDDMVFVGDTMRYRIALVCDGDTSEWTERCEIEINSSWPISIDPMSITATIDPLNPAPVAFTVRADSISTDEFLLQTSTAQVLYSVVNKDDSSVDSLVVGLESDSLLNESNLEQTVVVTPFWFDPPSDGTYLGTIPLSIVHHGYAEERDNYLILIRLEIDTPTFVRESTSSESLRSDGLRIRVLDNRFDDEIRLMIDGWPIDEVSPLMSESSAANITIVNILGQVMRHEKIDPATSTMRSLTISGTGAWPTGVYFGQIRWGRLVSTVRMVHVK